MPEANKTTPRSPHLVEDAAPHVIPAAPADNIPTNSVVDETGARLDVPEDKTVTQAHFGEPTIGATGPTNWWRIGIVVMGILILALIILQLMSGGSVAPTTGAS